MDSVWRLGFATIGFVAAYVAGAAMFLAVTGAIDGASPDDPDVARWALVPIGFLWLLVGSFVGRWWALSVPLLAYAIYTLSGDPISYGPGALTLEHLLILALASLGVGVALSGKTGP